MTSCAISPAKGISPDRLKLGHEQPPAGYLGVYQDIDISLDTFPWSGHTAACQSLWMGVPIVTLRGNRYAGRMVASVLHHAGLVSLVANTLDDYVRIGGELAGDIVGLAKIRAGLRERMSRALICDQKGFTRDLEQAYEEMWERWRMRNSHT